MFSWLSAPPIRKASCCQAKRARSRVVKKFREASPRAKWKIDAPIIIVLSTSKKAPAVGSGSTAGALSTSAAAAEAAPARTAGSAELPSWLRRLRRATAPPTPRRRRRGLRSGQELTAGVRQRVAPPRQRSLGAGPGQQPGQGVRGPFEDGRAAVPARAARVRAAG